MTNLQSGVFDEAFREKYRFHIALAESVVCLHGYDFACIGNNESRWDDTDIITQSACLYQNGNITIVNPDKAAEIAFIGISTHKPFIYDNRSSSFNKHGDFGVALLAFPRDAQTLDKTDSVFAQNLKQQVPSALFTYESSPTWLSKNGAYLPHSDFVKKQLSASAVSGWGLKIDVLSGSHPDAHATRKFLESDMLSPNQTIRQAFAELLTPFFCDKQKAFLPQENNLPFLDAPQCNT